MDTVWKEGIVLTWKDLDSKDIVSNHHSHRTLRPCVLQMKIVMALPMGQDSKDLVMALAMATGQDNKAMALDRRDQAMALDRRDLVMALDRMDLAMALDRRDLAMALAMALDRRDLVMALALVMGQDNKDLDLDMDQAMVQDSRALALDQVPQHADVASKNHQELLVEPKWILRTNIPGWSLS